MKLKPCPFCGGKAAFRDDGRSGEYVECRKCRACSAMMFPEKCDVKGLIAERWNNRSTPPGTPPAVPAEVRRLLSANAESLSRIATELRIAGKPLAADFMEEFRFNFHIARRALGIDEGGGV
jgi:Restriction alleviation protein Lar